MVSDADFGMQLAWSLVFILKNKDRLLVYHSRDFIEYDVYEDLMARFVAHVLTANQGQN